MPNSPASPLPLLGVTAAELHHAARRWFGDAKGAGVAPLVHRMAVREARFDPAALVACQDSAQLQMLMCLEIAEFLQLLLDRTPAYVLPSCNARVSSFPFQPSYQVAKKFRK